MATEAEVLAIVQRLLDRLDDLDPAYRAMLPSHRLIEACCPDLDLTYHATWRTGDMGELREGPAPERPDIRVAVDSDDLKRLVDGDLTFTRAYADSRVKVRAGVTDLIRLRAAL